MYTNGFHIFLIPKPPYTENYWGSKRAFAYVDYIYCYHPSCCSVTQSCSTLCDPMDCSMPGFSVLYHHLEFAQTHIHWVMPFDHLILSHPLLLLPSIFPASGSFPMSQLFALSGQSIGASVSASVLTMNIYGWFPLGLILLETKTEIFNRRMYKYIFH